MALPPVFVELKANIGEFKAKLGEASHEIDHLSHKGAGSFDKLASAGKGALLGLGTAAIGVGGAALHMADQYEVAHAHLETALKNTGKATEDFGRKVKSANAQFEALGYTNAQVEEALARLTTATNDPRKAMGLLGDAVNLARLRNIDLADAAVAVGKASNGQLRPLKQLGIDLPVVAGGAAKVAAAQKALAKAQEAYQALLGKSHTAHGTSVADANALARAKAHLEQVEAGASTTRGRSLADMQAIERAQQRVSQAEERISAKKVRSVADTQALSRAQLAYSQTLARVNAHASQTVTGSGALAAAQAAYAEVLARVQGRSGRSVVSADALARAQDKVRTAQEKLNGLQTSGGQIIEGLRNRTKGAATAFGETFAGKVQILHARVSDLLKNLGLRLIPVLTTVADKTLRVARWFERHSTVAKVLAGVIGTVLVAAIGAYIYKLVIAAAASVTSYAKMIATAAVWVAEQVAGFAAVAVSAVSAFASMALAALPWILAIGAVVLAGYLIYRNWRTIWNFIKSITKDAIDFVTHHLTLILTIIGGPFGLVLGVLIKHWRGVWTGIKAVTHLVWTTVLKPIFDSLIATIHGVIAVVLWLWRHVWEPELRIAGKVLHAIWDDFLKPVFGFIVDKGLRVIGAEVRVLRDIWHGVWHGIQTAVEKVWDVLRPIFEAIKRAVGDLTGGIGKVTGAVGGALGKAGKWLGFADGGPVPGYPGQPRLAVVHGGEYVLSRDMLRHGGAPQGVGGGGDTWVHTVLNLDGKTVYETVQRHALRQGRRAITNGLTA
jgi:hypothetical protein